MNKRDESFVFYDTRGRVQYRCVPIGGSMLNKALTLRFERAFSRDSGNHHFYQKKIFKKKNAEVTENRKF